MTKRLNIIHVDMEQVVANPDRFNARMQEWAFLRDNYGVKAVGLEEEVEQMDIALGELDAVIMTQYQIVAAAAEVPSTKLLGTTPKGFQATGEFEESSYHETLESIQQDIDPLIERHTLLTLRSEICPRFGIVPFETTVTWKPLDSPTAKELAATNYSKAQADQILAEAGAIDGNDIRARLVADPESGYTGMATALPADAEPHLPGGTAT